MSQNLDDLELYLQADFMLLAGHETYVRPDFHVSIYPVSARDFRELVEKTADISEKDGKLVKMATWREAIHYCNLLSRLFGLPVAYDENGYLINPVRQPVRDISEARGFRLPTPREWEYAAMGGMKNGKMDDWRRILENAYYQESGSGKSPEIENLGLNTIGLHGMLGNVKEWCSDCDYSREIRNPICGWSSYYSNYDVMSYNVRTDFLDRKDIDREACRFRLAFLKM